MNVNYYIIMHQNESLAVVIGDVPKSFRPKPTCAYNPAKEKKQKYNIMCTSMSAIRYVRARIIYRANQPSLCILKKGTKQE